MDFTYGEFISVCQKVLDAALSTVVFQMIHHVRSVSFDLFAASHCTEHDFSKTLQELSVQKKIFFVDKNEITNSTHLRRKRSEANTTNRCTIFDDCQCFVLSINQSLGVLAFVVNFKNFIITNGSNTS